MVSGGGKHLARNLTSLGALRTICDTNPVLLEGVRYLYPSVQATTQFSEVLADPILRLHDPVSGLITYDGRDIRSFTQESYRQRFGVVSQECLLFNATVEENIAYWRSIDSEVVNRVARVAHASGFIERLPREYQTIVGDRGINLSGVQRQRIAIARVLYGKPDILILDEATSALDSESEKQVQEAIAEAVKGMTAIIIAHRLSTVMQADRIVVLNHGAIEAIGRHYDLLEKSQLYKRLYEAQFCEAENPVAGQAVEEAYIPH